MPADIGATAATTSRSITRFLLGTSTIVNDVRYDEPVSVSHDSYPDVAIVGIGNMGLPMAAHLLTAATSAGTALWVHARERERADALLGAGARWASTPSALAAAPIILSVLPDLPQLEPMLWGDTGLVQVVERPTVLLIASTSSPQGVRELARGLDERSGGLIHVVDCPVSGGTDGATAADLAIMVGGEGDDVARALPVLEHLGRPVHLGPLGAGEVAKACNQAIVAATVLALGEAAVLAERSGIDVGALFHLLSGGYAGSRIMETRGQRIAERDYRVSGPAKYMVKDLGFALDEAGSTGTSLPLVATARHAFAELTENGMGDSDIAVVRAYIESLAAP
jgi:2-hydroxy-3-oxopropionate reductase